MKEPAKVLVVTLTLDEWRAIAKKLGPATRLAAERMIEAAKKMEKHNAR